MALALINSQFAKWTPDEARKLAEAIKAKWDESDAAVPQRHGARLCRVCQDPGRVETDVLLLLGTGMKAAAARYPGYDHQRIRGHFAKHVLPAVSGALVSEPKLLLSVPFPANGDAEEKDAWFVANYFALRNLALAPREPGSPDLRVAILAMDKMREVLAEGAKRPLASANGAEPAPTDYEVEDHPESRARVMNAFSRSEAGEVRPNDREGCEPDDAPAIPDDAPEGDH